MSAAKALSCLQLFTGLQRNDDFFWMKNGGDVFLLYVCSETDANSVIYSCFGVNLDEAMEYSIICNDSWSIWKPKILKRMPMGFLRNSLWFGAGRACVWMNNWTGFACCRCDPPDCIKTVGQSWIPSIYVHIYMCIYMYMYIHILQVSEHLPQVLKRLSQRWFEQLNRVCIRHLWGPFNNFSVGTL